VTTRVLDDQRTNVYLLFIIIIGTYTQKTYYYDIPVNNVGNCKYV